MSGTGGDHYATLQVERSASPADVKRAYFRLVRVHTPEDDPARFQAISEAYRVLSDPDARKAYDAEERLPPAVVAALGRAEALAESDPDEAVAAAKAVLAANLRSFAVRVHVAAVCLKAGRAAEALPIAEALVRSGPRRADLAEMLGDALIGSERLDDAERAYQTAIGLDPRRIGAYVGLANVHDARGAADTALQALEGGIEACGAADLRTLPLRVRKLYVLARDGRWDEMERVVTSILSIVPTNDRDAAEHAAMQLAWLARRYDEARIYDVAKFALDAAQQLAPQPWMRARSEELAPHAAMARDARRAQKDPRVARWIVALIRARLGSGMSEAEFRKFGAKLTREMTQDVLRKDREWATFAGWYPAVADVLQDIRDALRSAATGEPTPARGTRSRRGRRGRAQQTSPVASALVGVLLTVLFAFGAAALLREKPKQPQLDWKALLPPAQTFRDSEERLQEQIQGLVAKEAARRGRKMTQEEVDEYLDGLRKRVRDPVK